MKPKEVIMTKKAQLDRTVRRLQTRITEYSAYEGQFTKLPVSVHHSPQSIQVVYVKVRSSNNDYIIDEPACERTVVFEHGKTSAVIIGGEECEVL